MIYFTVYRNVSGRIKQIGTCLESTFEQQILGHPECGIVEGHFDAKSTYFVEGQPVARPTLPGPAGTRWDALPANCEVIVDGTNYGVNPDTWFELETDLPGVHRVTLRPPFPYIEASWEIVIDAPEPES